MTLVGHLGVKSRGSAQLVLQIIVSRHLIGAACERICFSNEGNLRALRLSGMKRVSG